MVLSQIIIERIQREGPLSFRDFMEMALYYPDLGYYNSEKDKIGMTGDFYTSANLTAAFGAMIGRQMEEMWLHLEKKPFTIVEYGAGTGLLCHDILDYLQLNIPLYQSLSYCIIEKSPYLREIQKKHLLEKVSWHNAIQDIPKINGCVLSNELIDNFSVHQVVMQEQLMEVFVDYSDHFLEILKPAKKELINYFTELKVQLPIGFRTEVNLEAKKWMKKISHSLQKGYVITIDYGDESAQLYNLRKSCGTLLCYHQHHKNDNPYQFIGEQDITTYINFSALSHWGSRYGLTRCGLANQAQFLLDLGIKDYQNSVLAENPNNLALAMQESMINYRLLIDMGMKFKVLLQQKGVPNYPLSGLKFLNSSPAIFM